MKSKFVDLNDNEVNGIEGGLLAGGLAGTILLGTVGLVVGTVATIATGDTSGKTLYKTTVAFALSGAAIGGATPI